jgi:hypothetical protein
MSGPSLDHFGHWIKKRVTRPTSRGIGQLLGQGAKSWYVYLLHTPVLPELTWRGPLGKQLPKILRRVEKVPGGDYPTPSLPMDAVEALVGAEQAAEFIAVATEREARARTLDTLITNHIKSNNIDKSP